METLEGLIIYGAFHDEITSHMEQGRTSVEGKILDSFYAPHSDLRSANFMSELHDVSAFLDSQQQMQFAFLEEMKIQETTPEFLKSVASRKVAHTTYIGLKKSDSCTKTYMSILQFYEPYKHNKAINISEKYATCKLVPKALILCMSTPNFKLGKEILSLIHEKVFLAGILNYIKASGIAQSSPFSMEDEESQTSEVTSLKIQKYSPLDVKQCRSSLEFYISLIFHYFTSDWGNEHIVNVIHSSDMNEPFLQFISTPPPSHYLSQADHNSLTKLTAPPFLLSAGSLKELFTLIPLDHLLELFRGLLLEQNILLIQSNYGKLGELMQQLLSLIRPLQFVPHAVRAFLTPGSLFLLQTALPALLGIARTFWSCRTQSGLDCNIIYDVDEKDFLLKNFSVSKLCQDAKLPNLELLRSSIADITGERERWIKEQDCDTYEEREELWWIYFSLKIRQAFFNYLLLLFNNYMDFFDKQPKRDPRRELKIDLQFDPESYLRVAPRLTRQFLKGVVDTNDFQYFLEKTYNVMHHSDKPVDPFVLSFTKAVVRLRQEGGLEKSKIKEDQDRQIRELIARCKHPVLISFDNFTNAYCDRLFSRKQLNETSYSTESDVDSDTWEPIYLPVEKIYREKVLEIRGDNYEEILRKSKQLQTTELMRQMKEMLKLRLKEAQKNEHKCHKRGASTKMRSQQRYRAAWQRLEQEVKQKKSELIASVPEVNQSSEVGESNFLKTDLSSDITGVDMSFKDVRGIMGCTTDYESTKPASSAFTSTNAGFKVAGYQSVGISTPLEAIENKKASQSGRPGFKAGDTPLLEAGSPVGGETPITGTWVNRDKSVLVTTQKKVVYADQDHLNGYKQEVHKLNSSRRLDFVAEEKKNMRCNTTTGPKEGRSRGGGFGRALFKDGKGNTGGGMFSAFRSKNHWNQENMNTDNFQEERELLKHAQTQISKYDQRLQDFSPYKPEYFAQRKIIQERIKNGNKAFKKLFNDKTNAFFPSDCESLVTKYAPRAISANKLRATAQLREKIDFGVFKNKTSINTSSGAFQNFRVNSMTARNRDLVSPSRKNGAFLFKTTTVMSPAQINIGSRTPQVSGPQAIKERSYIATPKTSMGAMKHSMSSMNTPTGVQRKVSGKVLFKGFTNELTASSASSQLACAVMKPVPGYKTCVTKGVLPSTPMSGSNSNLQKIGRVGPCTLGASIGSKFSGVASSQTLKSAFKPQASRKLFQSGQTSARASGQDRQAIPMKYISSFTKTPFDKASASKQEGLLSSGGTGIGGFKGKYGAFHSPHDDIKKELNFHKNSLH